MSPESNLAIETVIKSIDVLHQDYYINRGHSEDDCFYYPDNNGGPIILNGQCTDTENENYVVHVDVNRVSLNTSVILDILNNHTKKNVEELYIIYNHLYINLTGFVEENSIMDRITQFEAIPSSFCRFSIRYFLQKTHSGKEGAGACVKLRTFS